MYIMVNRTRRNRKHKRKHHSRRYMKGGAFTQNEIQQLQSRGFDEFDIDTLSGLSIPFNVVIQSYNTISESFGSGNSDDMIFMVMNELTNQYSSANQQQNINNSQNSSFNSNGSLHLSDLQSSQDSQSSNFSGYTDDEDMSGGKKRRKSRKLKSKKRKTRMRGGGCYGTGVGANNYDPNFSIYNTNMLKIFPYKPN